LAIILGFTTKVGHGSGATSGPGQNLVEWLGLTEKHQAIVPIGPPKFLFFLVKSVKSKFCVVKCDELSQDFLVSTVQYLFFLADLGTLTNVWPLAGSTVEQCCENLLCSTYTCSSGGHPNSTRNVGESGCFISQNLLQHYF
jgi:hypothetical protein